MDGATARRPRPDSGRALHAGAMPRYVESPVTRLAALILALVMAHPLSAAVPSCKKSCRNLQANCLGFAKTALEKARGACSGSTRRKCRHDARVMFGHDRQDCRTLARTTCLPCCKLGAPTECAHQKGVPLPKEDQTPGDAVHGRQVLLNGDYMTCGVPYTLWGTLHLGDAIAQAFGGKADVPRIPDREGKNADLPYFLNAFTAPSGAEVINANCLLCHGGVFDGQLIIGLGNPVADFTRGAGGVANGLTPATVNALPLTDVEKTEMLKILDRATIVAPFTVMRTIGMNPAEMLAVILMVHHDRDTLAWSDTTVTPVPLLGADGLPVDDRRLTSDPPPWWRAHKKNALFYNGMARGDHRGTMALATSVCVDEVPRAQYVDGLFKDIQAFVDSVRSPPYTRTIDHGLAEQGKALFTRDCSGCHGTYPPDKEEYPSLLIPLDTVGTDPVVAQAGIVYAPQLVAWYNASFYGQITRMEPADPLPGGGYMPPPLDGIWATAPYLHNGSVPTVELVLNSRARPKYWKRVDLDSTHFDEQALGWPYTALDAPPAAPDKLVYDTTLWSQSNAGHTFGDHLTAAERRAVIEYLKTL